MQINSKYIPLIALLFVSTSASLVLALSSQRGLVVWMHYFMGFFLCQFALIKLFHLGKFVEGFRKYDLVAQKVPLYGFCYPFLELVLGLFYLSLFHFPIVYFVTVFIAVIGSFSVVRALKQGLDVRCACMGTILDVPLSTVTLAEDLGMGGMALLMFVCSV